MPVRMLRLPVALVLAVTALGLALVACDTEDDEAEPSPDVTAPTAGDEAGTPEATPAERPEATPVPDLTLDLSVVAAQIEDILEEIRRRFEDLSEEQITATFQTAADVCEENERRLDQSKAAFAASLSNVCDEIRRAVEDGEVTQAEVDEILDQLQAEVPSPEAVQLAARLADRSREVLNRLEAGSEQQAEQLGDEMARTCAENLRRIEGEESEFVQQLRDVCDQIQETAEEEGVDEDAWRDIVSDLGELVPTQVEDSGRDR